MTRLAPSPRTGRRSSPWVALLGLLLLVGGVWDVHPHGERHSFLEALGTSEYSPEAAHPEQPLHLEPGTVVSQPHCPACLHRLQLGGIYLEAAADLVPPAPRERLPAQDDPRCARGTCAPSGARAPPLS